ncbi:hypothetical protein D1P53_005447 [Cryptococcus gattii VGV]|nr:hypothetical protein D1P53_005447 [Cryptococcus gattii VGV]
MSGAIGGYNLKKGAKEFQRYLYLKNGPTRRSVKSIENKYLSSLRSRCWQTAHNLTHETGAGDGEGSSQFMLQQATWISPTLISVVIENAIVPIATSGTRYSKVDMAQDSLEDNTVYGAVAAYIPHHSMDAKHMDVWGVRQNFSQILSSANLRDEGNVVLRLDHHGYDKEADKEAPGGFKTEVTASLNVPLNERNLFNQDKTRFMASKLDDQDGVSSDINLWDLPGCLPSFLFAWPPQDNGDDRASFFKSRLVAKVLQVFNLGPASLRKKSQYGVRRPPHKDRRPLGLRSPP